MGAHTLTALALADPDRVAASSRSGRPGSACRRPRSRCATGTGSPTGSSAVGWRGSSPPTTTASTRSGATRCCGSPASGCCAIATPRRSRRCGEVPRSSPFDDLAELELLDVPALVVASHDEADPGHPYAVAEAWAERLPRRAPGQRGGGGVPARLAGRPALARDRRLLRQFGRGGPPLGLAPSAGRRVDFARQGNGFNPSAGGASGSRAGGRGAGRTRSHRSRRPCCRPGRARSRAPGRRPRSGRSALRRRASARRSRGPPAGKTVLESAARRRSSSARRRKKATATSSEPAARLRTVTASGSAPSAAVKSGGAPGKATVEPSLIPSLRGSGVPE